MKTILEKLYDVSVGSADNYAISIKGSGFDLELSGREAQVFAMGILLRKSISTNKEPKITVLEKK